MSLKKVNPYALTAAWLGITAGLAFLSLPPTSFSSQLFVSISLIVVLLAWQKYSLTNWTRRLFLFVSVFIVVRYLFWRTTSTLVFDNFFTSAGSLALFAAEIYAILIFLFGVLVNLYPIAHQPLPPQGTPSAWPMVDILIPTYNEELEIVETTLIAAQQIEYPQDRFKIYLCDDGGSEEKIKKSAEARKRSETLSALCKKMGITYLTRANNLFAKAGNLNEALKKTKGDLVLILDVDHVPVTNILKDTVGWFEKDPKIFLVQTPHFFINPDPVERNLEIFSLMPRETDMFYRYIQPGLDFWNASFFCGSAALLRRKHLEEIGGLSGETITEDAETSLALHARGYRSIYIDKPMIAGLAPGTFSDFVRQRMRWAQGMTQLLLLKKPWKTKGLTWAQRFCYTSICGFWFFSYARLIFLLAPALFLLFGIKIFQAQPREFLIYSIPYLSTILVTTNFLFGKVRWFFISELYELLQSFFCLPAITKVFFNPKASQFQVTSKNVSLEKDYVSPLSMPFYIAFVITMLSFVAGVLKLFHPHHSFWGILACLFWASLNALWMLAAMGVLYEKRQLRRTVRIPTYHITEIYDHDKKCSGITRDFSLGGCSIWIDQNDAPPMNHEVTLQIKDDQEKIWQFQTIVRRREKLKFMKGYLLGVEFNPLSENEIRDKIKFLFGNSERWKELQYRKTLRVPTWESMSLLARLGCLHSYKHAIYILQILHAKIKRIKK